MSANLQFINMAAPERLVRYTEETLNVSNSNTRDILVAMGFNPDFDSPDCDPIIIDSFIHGAEMFLSSPLGEYIDNEKPYIQEGNWIEGGRRQGYLKVKILLILAYAKHAQTLGATHAYFI